MAGYKVLALTQEMFCSKFRGKNPGYEIVQGQLPSDAKVVRMELNMATGELEFLIYSEQYEWVKQGAPVPYAPVPLYLPWEGKP